MTAVLGIHDGHNASACLIKDGKIIAAASEERFTRIKNQEGIPVNAIKFCLEKANPELIVFGYHYMSPMAGGFSGGSNLSNHHSLSFFKTAGREFLMKYNRKIEEILYKKLTRKLRAKVRENRIKELRKVELDNAEVLSIDHHFAHAYSAIYASGFKEALVITVDGEGDSLCSSVNIFKDGKLKRIAESYMGNSLGLFYTQTTSFLGMKPLEHEYKVMGLAPYVPKNYGDELYNQIKNIIKVEGLQFKSKIHSHLYDKFIKKAFQNKRFDNIAYAAQRLVEDRLVELIKNSIKHTKIDTLALAGGVFMNVKANMLIASLPEVKKMFVMPSASDESTAIGAAYYGSALNGNEIKPLKDLYFGPEFSEKEIEKVLEKEKFSFEKTNNKKISSLLAEGKIVARFDGKMEFGARALGNRSILAKADNEEVKKEINKMIKNRDFWMPFAPSIISAKCVKEPKIEKTNPEYMIFAYKSTKKAAEHLKAAMHPYDNTIRPQLVKKDWNESYFDLLKKFKDLTGYNGLLNTSFNLHGSPIVCSPADALFVFKNSSLNYLNIGNFLVCKKAF